MIRKSKVVGLIPARAGSKRLSNKNLMPLAGKPLIAWTIEAALKSRTINEVVVSTDSNEIRKVALEYGAEVPFMRPRVLAHDTASSDDVIMHAIKELMLSPADIIILLQPTSPLRDSYDIDSALDGFKEDHVMGVVTVSECEHSPLWASTLPDDFSMANFIKPDIADLRSQDLPVFYRLNGAIFAYRVEFLNRHRRRIYSADIRASIMSVDKSIDIDNPIDFKFADFLIQEKFRNLEE